MVINLKQSNLQLGESQSTAYRGDRGKTAYNHSQIAHAPSDAEKNVNADWNATSGDAQILNKPTITGGGGRTPYGAIVYTNDGTTVYAADAVGAVISSGTNFSTVLQAAINSLNPSDAASNGGSIFVATADYTLTATVTVRQNISIEFEKNSTVIIGTNVDGFIIENGAHISGLRADVSSVISPGYQNTVVTIDGTTIPIRSRYTCGLDNCEFYNGYLSGTAILFKSDSGTSGYIYGVIVQNARINMFENGIKFHITSNDTNWINSNKISDVWYNATTRMVIMESDQTSGYSDFANNLFDNIVYQSDASYVPTAPAIVIDGRYNVFLNIKIWDWLPEWGSHTSFLERSLKNIFETAYDGDITLITDAGTNIVRSPDVGETVYHNVRNARNAIYTRFGYPTVEEIALGRMSNKLRFIPATSQEQSTDGITWTTSTRLTAAKLADLMIGGGQEGTNATAIPIATVGDDGYYRLTWTAASNFGLSFLRLYCDTGANATEFKIEALNSSGAWVEICAGTAATYGDYVEIPHTNLTLRTNYTSVPGTYGAVRVTFSIVDAVTTDDLILVSLEWFGDYPIASRDVIAYDSAKNAAFPGGITSGGIFHPVQATTAAAPAYIKGGVYFDTTLNKLRVGGASGWETLPSS